MRRTFAGGLAVALSSTLALLPATAAAASDDPHSSGELKAALIRKKDGLSGYKAFKPAATTATRFLNGKTRYYSWAFSHTPDRCRTSATTGLLFDSAKVELFPSAPAAMAEFWSKYALGESLISVPADLPDSTFKQVIPSSCRKFHTKFHGKRITVRIVRLKSAQLPVIPGAYVVGAKMILPPHLWGNAVHGENTIIVVRSGTLVLETYTDTFGSVDAKAISFTLKAWQRASSLLS
jgi:hypothetical protein